MTEAPQSYGQTWASDERPELPQTGDERTMLTAYLDHHRATFELKCRGVEPARLNERTMPPSTLTLHGLLRHLTGVERCWFQINFAGDRRGPPPRRRGDSGARRCADLPARRAAEDDRRVRPPQRPRRPAA